MAGDGHSTTATGSPDEAVAAGGESTMGMDELLSLAVGTGEWAVGPLEAETRLAYRPMVATDYAAVREIAATLTRCSKFYSEKEITALLSISTFHPIVVVENRSGEIVAYVELYRLPHVGRGFDGRLERLVVRPGWQGRGIGSRLTNLVLQEARRMGCGRVDLTVEAPDARHVYQTKMKFVEVETTSMRRML